VLIAVSARRFGWFHLDEDFVRRFREVMKQRGTQPAFRIEIREVVPIAVKFGLATFQPKSIIRERSGGEDQIVALTNAEKQARYRERYLGVNGEKRRLTLFIDASTGAQLDPLAHRKGYSVTAVVEELAERAERRITSKLSGKALRAYLERE
jgi:hypothetical protein